MVHDTISSIALGFSYVLLIFSVLFLSSFCVVGNSYLLALCSNLDLDIHLDYNQVNKLER